MSREVRFVMSVLVCIMLSAAVVLAGCSSTPAPVSESAGSGQGAAEQPASEGADAADPGATLVDQKCSMCHTLDRVRSAQYDKAGWTATVERMQKNGLVVTDEEKTAIIEYLSNE